MLKNLRKLRIDNEISYERLSKVLGCNRSTVFNWENEFTKPTLEDLIKLSDYFNVSIDYLLDRDDRKKRINELFIELKKVDHQYILNLIKKHLENKN